MMVRLSLALLVVIPAAMAYPWSSARERWLLGAAVGVVVVLFAWWRGSFVTTMIGHRIAMWRRRGRLPGNRQRPEFSTVVLQVIPRHHEDLPLALITGYLDRYGIRFDKVRVTSRDENGVRTTWVGLTLGAADNIAALSARSSTIPAMDTVALTARRLADHLREMGWQVEPAGPVELVDTRQVRERWRGVEDGRGHLAAYRIAVDDALADTLSDVRACGSAQIWTVLEFTGSRAHPELTAACALRTDERPEPQAPLAGLTPERGQHGLVLATMAPMSDHRLPGRPVAVSAESLARVRRPAGRALSRT